MSDEAEENRPPAAEVTDSEEDSAGEGGICRVWLRLKLGVEGGGPERELPLPLPLGEPAGNAGRDAALGVWGVCTDVADVDRSLCGGAGPRKLVLRSSCSCDC